MWFAHKNQGKASAATTSVPRTADRHGRREPSNSKTIAVGPMSASATGPFSITPAAAATADSANRPCQNANKLAVTAHVSGTSILAVRLMAVK